MIKLQSQASGYGETKKVSLNPIEISSMEDYFVPQEVADRSPLLAGIYAIESANCSIEEIAAELVKVLKQN